MIYNFFFIIEKKEIMKCIKALRKNGKFNIGDVIRVKDELALDMVGQNWKYVPKSEWKLGKKTKKKK